MVKDIEVIIINQLSDNYSYIVYSLNNKEALIIDPAESKPIIECLNKNKLSLKGILITHHHSDHTSGIEDLLSLNKAGVYTPNINISGTTQLIKNKDNIFFDFADFEVIATPGHTLDHVVFYFKKNNLLFSGDTLFSLGCGRIFEGSYEQMFQSLQNINNLPDETIVYCGHEYTIQNYKFLNSIFSNYQVLDKYKDRIDSRLKKSKRTVPFRLGDEKIMNPFLSSNVTAYRDFMKNNSLDNLNFFKYLRRLKDNY